MSELQSVQQLLEEAARAANAGELASAAILLQDAARIQEAELGPLHPELANTLNNLGIVAENQGQLSEAETYYRRAVAITSAILPPDDPMVASSRKNLEDFCRERGLPFDPSAAAPSRQPTEHPTDEAVHDQATGEADTPAEVNPAHTDVAAQTLALPPDTRPVADARTDDAGRLSASPVATPRPRAALAIGLAALVVVAAALLITRACATRESPASAPTHEPTTPQAAEPAPPRPSAPAPAPIEQPQPPSVASHNDKSSVAGVTPPAPRSSSAGITLVTSQLCRTFSGNNWRCDPADQSVAPGAIVLYTRVKSPHDAVVIHRWYRGDTLKKSARLTILANTTEGYRTYSRQAVKSGENWRVEVTTTAGDVLYEQRVSVR
jgi:tetratricopeptide repeat protein/DUF2914 family protein